jgi:hypothetical protein
MLRKLYLFLTNLLHILVGFLAGLIGGDQSIAITITYIAYQYFEYMAIHDDIVHDILVYLASMSFGFAIKIWLIALSIVY